MALGWLWWRAWVPVDAVDAAAFCMAGVALGDMDLHFAWQAWHVVTSLPSLKWNLRGGGVVLKFHFKIPFLQSCFLNDQYSSSFHVFGKQMKIKYLRLAPEELSTCQTEAAHM